MDGHLFSCSKWYDYMPGKKNIAIYNALVHKQDSCYRYHSVLIVCLSETDTRELYNLGQIFFF